MIAARGNQRRVSASSVRETGAEPMRMAVTEDRSVRASRASSRSSMAIIVGTEVSAVTRCAPIASM